MPFEDAKSHLEDIRETICLIQEFVAGMNFETFRYDLKTQAAVERKILIISEAAIRLKGDAEVLCPGVPWRDIRGSGNWLRHQYDSIDLETIWNTIHDDLPPLKAAVMKVLTEGDQSS